MPILDSSIQNELLKIFDTEFSDFEGFPETSVEVADRWATAIDTALNGQIIPTVLPTGYSTAKTSFQSTMLTLPASGIVAIQLAFTNYALGIVAGMLPAFIGVPPPVPIDFTPAYAIGQTGDNNACAKMMGTIISLWLKTGTATPSGGGSPIFWT